MSSASHPAIGHCYSCLDLLSLVVSSAIACEHQQSRPTCFPQRSFDQYSDTAQRSYSEKRQMIHDTRGQLLIPRQSIGAALDRLLDNVLPLAQASKRVIPTPYQEHDIRRASAFTGFRGAHGEHDTFASSTSLDDTPSLIDPQEANALEMQMPPTAGVVHHSHLDSSQDSAAPLLSGIDDVFRHLMRKRKLPPFQERNSVSLVPFKRNDTGVSGRHDGNFCFWLYPNEGPCFDKSTFFLESHSSGFLCMICRPQYEETFDSIVQHIVDAHGVLIEANPAF